MHGTQQIWNLVLQEGPCDNHTAPRTNPYPKGGLGIDPRIGAAALRAPTASKEDSRPQAILKLRPRNSFDYRVRYEPQPTPQINCQLIVKT